MQETLITNTYGKPHYIDEAGALAKKKLPPTLTERAKLAKKLAAEVKATGDVCSLHELWELVYVYLLSLDMKGNLTLRGRRPQSFIGQAYELLAKVAIDYKPESGVPFILYYRTRLAGHLQSWEQVQHRQRCGDYECTDDFSPEQIASASDQAKRLEVENLADAFEVIDEDEIIYLADQLGESQVDRIIWAYIECYRTGASPHGARVAKLAGINVRVLSESMDAVSTRISSLII